jgi:hypothetical protein
MNEKGQSEWEQIKPSVNPEAEFLEIVHDFGDPLEILREAISNAIDWGATQLKIGFEVKQVEGVRRLVIQFTDNGQGMKREVLAKDFWGLGYSRSRELKETEGKQAIGEKGHGTKIFLRSEKVIVKTQTAEGAYLSECDRPLAALSQHRLHEPRIKQIEPFTVNTGTEITIIGYNGDQAAIFWQRIVKDYLLWFTKIGSVERIFGIDKHKNFKILLKALDYPEYEAIEFGHVFPEENADLVKLYELKQASAANWFVKRYVKSGVRLEKQPQVVFDVVISVEGDSAKRLYNGMIRDRSRKDSGSYKVSDRYGIYLCKDFIPIKRVNEWITGFGTGSNSFVLLHGFVNCQELKLTANRGDIANTDPEVLRELQIAIGKIIEEINSDLHNCDLFTLHEWEREERTLEQEKNEFLQRVKNLKVRKTALLQERLLVEPQNEAELFGLFMTVYALCPEKFKFQPLDYSTYKGIDVIARNKSDSATTEGDHAYVELKHILRTQFNHAYKYLSWILCWDFDESIKPGTSEFLGVEENDIRVLHTDSDDDGHAIYFLDNRKKPKKIEVIRLKEFLKQRLNLEFEFQK